MYQPQAHGSGLDYARNVHAQSAPPPGCILGPLDGRLARDGLVFGHTHAAHQQANGIHPRFQRGALAYGQCVQLVRFPGQLLGHGADFVIVKVPQAGLAELVLIVRHRLHQIPGLRPLGRLLQPFPVRQVLRQDGRHFGIQTFTHG